jgi:arginine exporter protein ArgO
MLGYGCSRWQPPPEGKSSLTLAGLRHRSLAGAAFCDQPAQQVYLEVVVIVGLAGLHFPAGERWLFGLGVALISPLWFFGLVFFGARLSPLLSRPSVVLAIDVAVGGTMIGLGLAILVGQTIA